MVDTRNHLKLSETTHFWNEPVQIAFTQTPAEDKSDSEEDLSTQSEDTAEEDMYEEN